MDDISVDYIKHLHDRQVDFLGVRIGEFRWNKFEVVFLDDFAERGELRESTRDSTFRLQILIVPFRLYCVRVVGLE